MNRIIRTIDHDLKGARTALECGSVTVLAGRVNGVGKTATLVAAQLAGTEVIVEAFDPGRAPAKTNAAIVDAVLLPGLDASAARVRLSDGTLVTVDVARKWKRERGKVDPVASHSVVRRVLQADGETPEKRDWRLDDLSCGVRALFDESMIARRTALTKMLPPTTPTDADLAKTVAGLDFGAIGTTAAKFLASLQPAAGRGALALVEWVSAAKNEHAAAAKADKGKLDDAEIACTLHDAKVGGATRESVDAERVRLHAARDEQNKALGADAQRAALYETKLAQLGEAKAAEGRAVAAEAKAAGVAARARARLDKPALAEVPLDEAETAAGVEAARSDFAAQSTAAGDEAWGAKMGAAESARVLAAADRAGLDGGISALSGITLARGHVALCVACERRITEKIAASKAERPAAEAAVARAITELRAIETARRVSIEAARQAEYAHRAAVTAHEDRQRHNAAIPERARLDKAERYAAEQAIAAHATASATVTAARAAVAEAQAEVDALAPGDEVRAATAALESIAADLVEFDAIDAKVKESARLTQAACDAKAASQRSYVAADLWATVAERVGLKGLAGRLLEAQSAPFDAMLAEVYGAMTPGRLRLRLFADGRECCDFVAVPDGSTQEYPMPMFNGANLAIAEVAIQVALMNLRGASPRILIRDSLQDIAEPRRLVAALARLVERDLLDQAIVAGCVPASDVAVAGAKVVDFTEAPAAAKAA